MATSASPPTPDPPAARIRGFTKVYRRRVALRGLDLTVQRGEIYGLIGPDGAGKSSLLKALAGVLTFDGGTVEVFGASIATEVQTERVKDRLGFMPQGLGLNLYPELTVEENIDYFAHLRLVPEGDLARRKERLLAMTRLDRFRHRPMKHLSGGMKQKLGLACTLIHEPELAILDEPTTGVDPVSRRDFWAILAEMLADRGMTAIVSTAYLDEASRFDRLSLVVEGRVVAEGEPDEVRCIVPGALVRVRVQPQAGALARLREHTHRVQATGSAIQLFLPETSQADAEATVSGWLGGYAVEELTAGEPELEDVFVELLERQARTQPADTVLAAQGSGSMSQAPNADAATQFAGMHAGTVDAMACTAISALQGTPEPRIDHVAIEARELTRDFGGFRAADRVCFTVRRGEIFGLLGANGAGKTTVIKMLTGILSPTVGTGRVAGKELGRAGADIRRRIGYVAQAFSLYQDLTVAENLRLYASIYGLGGSEARRQMEWALGMGGLRGHERDLSGSLPMGLRQRLALGCALLHRPQVLFLDEPTSGVDPIGRRTFWHILFDLSRTHGVTILVTTHYMSEAEHCDHLALMHAGRIVDDASPEEMKRRVQAEAGTLLELTARQPARALAALRRAGIGDPSLYGKHVHLLTPMPERDAACAVEILRAAAVTVDSVRPVPLTMEDVFVYRVTASERQAAHGAGHSCGRSQ